MLRDGPIDRGREPCRTVCRGGYRARRLTIVQVVTGVGVALLFVFIFGPLIWLMLWAFAGVWHYPALLPQQWSLSWWRQVFDYPQLARSVGPQFYFCPGGHCRFSGRVSPCCLRLCEV